MGTTVEFHRLRVRRIIDYAFRHPDLQLNPATWLAVHRTDLERAPVGCLLGHFILWSNDMGARLPISLEPIRWLSEIKRPEFLAEAMDDLPPRDWQHYQVHYRGDGMEGWGTTAALLYLRMKPDQLGRVLWPHKSYGMQHPLASLVDQLQRYALQPEDL